MSRRLTIDENIELSTQQMKTFLSNGGLIISIRGRVKKILPFDVRFAKGQMKDHNALSEDGHEWEVAEHGQTRRCVKCLISQCCPPKWVGFPSSSFTKEDIPALIRINEKKV